ncbi:unnamed protein product, partial [Musa acuminata var. zebrina]
LKNKQPNYQVAACEFSKQACSFLRLQQSATMALASRASLLLGLMIVAVIAPVAIAQLGNIIVSGTVPCSTSTTTVTAATPVFPNATVLLQCGSNVISSAITNSNGVFTMLVNPVDSLLTLLNSCKLVIPTPLSTCNTSLPSTGILQSSLQLLSRGLLGGILGGILNFVPTLFTFVGSLG